ncbi:hypothetical protein [Spirosoma oryzicola]|uniref:hypothetical protein n=1 Tax=Spirosoma oryzicola TaxID=2898794 RepID=UPI001E402A75|nr:hypothetical protein [Spirosoma oryzicola]UHG93387.1 hypothetical protein LQ777_10890 [Spirosoma oryzicola]
MLRKKILFWLTWLILGPLVMVYFCGVALFSRRRRSVLIRTQLVYQSVWQNLVIEKPLRRRVLSMDRYRFWIKR